MIRPTWHQYFMLIAGVTASRSTCLSLPVGAVIVRNKQILAHGYNAAPPDTPHCTAQGFCYEGVGKCSESHLPSRAVHAEANAIALAAKYGNTTDGAAIYSTLEPCLSCLKLIISAGISEIYYESSFDSENPVKVSFIKQGIITCTKVDLPAEMKYGSNVLAAIH